MYSFRSLAFVGLLLASLAEGTGRAEDSTSDRPDFSGHLVVDPNTTGHLKFDYDAAPGMPFFVRTMDGAFLVSAIQLGIGDRFEIGTVPVNYLMESGGSLNRNLTMKWNFYRSPLLSVAVGYMLTYTEFKLPQTLSDGTPAPWPAERWRMYSNGLTLTSASALTDKLSLGVSASVNIALSNIAMFSTPLRQQLGAVETYSDLSYRVAIPLSLTLGFTRTRAPASQQADFGAGATVTWRRPECFFSKPAFGAHHLFGSQSEGFQQPRNVYLLSTTFY